MRSITKRTLQEIRGRFATANGYILNEETPIYCPQVNGLTNLCLNEFGLKDEAQKNCLDFSRGASRDYQTRLFRREVDLTGRVISPELNSGKNSILALAFSACGLNVNAKEIMDNLKLSPTYDKQNGLFTREYNPISGEVNPMLVTQSNLWASLAYSSLGKIREAKNVIRALESSRYDSDLGLFIGQDCRDKKNESRFFVDDQALASLAYSKIGENQKAEEIIKTVLGSQFYDAKSGLFNSSFSGSDVDNTKSTYKNSFMAFALGKLGHCTELCDVQGGLIRELYDYNDNLFCQTTKDKTKVPDNSALALVALERPMMKLGVF